MVMAVSNRVLHLRPTACVGGPPDGVPWGIAGAGGRLDSPRRTAAAVLGPCPPTAAVLAQILARSPDFSYCKRIVDGCVMLIVGIEGSAARAQEQVVGCVEERDGWHVDDHAVAPA